MDVENMNEYQLQQALRTITDDQKRNTIVDNNGNENKQSRICCERVTLGLFPSGSLESQS